VVGVGGTYHRRTGLCKGTVRADGERRGERRGANRRLGGCRAGFGGGTITAGPGSGASPARPGDGGRLPLHFLVEDVLGLRLRQCVPVAYHLDDWGVPGGWRACRADPGRLDRLADVVENPLNGSGLGDEGDDVCGVRYRVDCRRSCSQGQRPLWVGDRPFADTSDRASSRRSLTARGLNRSRGKGAAGEVGS
jgi:hypothetical protein